MKTILKCYFVFTFVFTNVNTLVAQWAQTSCPLDAGIYDFAASPRGSGGTNLFAGGWQSGVFLSTNNGTSWDEINDGLTDNHITSLAAHGTSVFAGTGQEISPGIHQGSLFLSTNNGSSWSNVNTSFTNTIISAIAVKDANVFVGTSDLGVFLSSDNGASWSEVNTGLTNMWISTLAVSGTNIFAGTMWGGVFRTTNNGTTWKAVNTGLTDTYVHPYVRSFAVSDTVVFAAIAEGYSSSVSVFLSTNNGTSWSPTPATLTGDIWSLAVSGTNLYAAVLGVGVFLSNNGKNWTSVNTGLPSAPWVRSLIVCSDGTNPATLFVGTLNNGIWKRPLSEMTTSVGSVSTDLPTHFNLYQNYPNPFNPVTTISFRLASRSLVVLKIFDVMGREVATLVNKELATGDHIQYWDASALSSGIYFYRLQAGPFVETRKLILLK